MRLWHALYTTRLCPTKHLFMFWKELSCVFSPPKTLNPFKYLATNTPNTENLSGKKSRLSSLTERRKEITSDFEIKISRPILWRV